MSPPERNKPCPCGSGRKFKSCCLLGSHGLRVFKREGRRVAEIPTEVLLEDLLCGEPPKGRAAERVRAAVAADEEVATKLGYR